MRKWAALAGIDLWQSYSTHTLSPTFSSTYWQSAQWSGSFAWLSIAFPECISAYGTNTIVYLLQDTVFYLTDTFTFIFSSTLHRSSPSTKQTAIHLPPGEVSTSWVKTSAVSAATWIWWSRTVKPHLLYTTCPPTVPYSSANRLHPRFQRRIRHGITKKQEKINPQRKHQIFQSSDLSLRVQDSNSFINMNKTI